MNKIVPASLLSVFLISIFFLFPKYTYANSFTYDFNSYINSDWDIHIDSDESVSANEQGELHLKSINRKSFPYLVKNITPSDQNIIEIKFKFSGVPFYGAGFALTDKNINYGITSGLSFNDAMIMVWANHTSGFIIGSSICPDNSVGCVRDHYDSVIYQGNSNDWYTIKIQKIEEKYTVSINDDEIFKSEITEREINNIWLGSPENTGETTWPEIYFDYVKLNNTEDNVTPVVIVPGIGASWDFDALLNGEDGTNWKVPEFVTVYDSLVKSFENEGYIKDENLFVFSYDWRKPLDELSDDLNAFLIGHIDSGQKINFVGHSMGGLVSRIYAQKNGFDKINKIITLGSPHQGAVDAYSLWEGAKLWGGAWWGKAAVETVVQVNQSGGKNRVDTLREQVPSIKDLLPTYNYLVFNGVDKNLADMNQKNDYMLSKNSAILDIKDRIIAFAGNGEDTKTKIRVERRSNFDSLFGLWEDGKPIKNNPFIYTAGDGTVNTASSLFNFSKTETFGVNHSGLPGDAGVIGKIFDEFELNKENIEIIPSDTKKSVFSVLLRSPGRLEVCSEEGNLCNDDLGIYDSDSKVFMLPGYNKEKLRVRVYADGLGQYKLHFGSMDDEANWKVVEGDLKSNDQIDEYHTSESDRILSVLPSGNTSDGQLTLCKSQLNNLSPKWDKQNNIEKLTRSTSFEQSAKTSRSLRLQLSYIWLKMNREKRNENADLMLGCWNTIDNAMVVPGIDKNNNGKTNHVSALWLFYDYTESRLKNTKSIAAYKALIASDSKIHETEYYGKSNKKLRNELAVSAQEMMLLALGLK